MPHPDAPTPLPTITGGGVSVRMWIDHDPAMPAVLINLDAYGQELHLPAGVARQVAAAIMETIPDKV